MLCFARGGHPSSEGGRSTSSIDILPSSGCITDRISSSCCVERKRERGLASSAHFSPTKQQAQQLFFSFHPQKWIEMDHHHPVSQWLSIFSSYPGLPIYDIWFLLLFFQCTPALHWNISILNNFSPKTIQYGHTKWITHLSIPSFHSDLFFFHQSSVCLALINLALRASEGMGNGRAFLASSRRWTFICRLTTAADYALLYSQA